MLITVAQILSNITSKLRTIANFTTLDWQTIFHVWCAVIPTAFLHTERNVYNCNVFWAIATNRQLKKLLRQSYENNQQEALYRLIYYSKSALHVSGDVFANRQAHLTVFTVSSSVHPSCCRLVEPTWNSKLTLRLLMSYIYIYIWSTYSWCF